MYGKHTKRRVYKMDVSLLYMSIYIYINYKCIFAYSILYLSTVQSPTDTFKTPRYIISFVFFAGPGCDLQVAS